MADRTRFVVVPRPATAHGWLRRPELATVDHDVWERPDGGLTQYRKGIVPTLVTRYDLDGAARRLP